MLALRFALQTSLDELQGEMNQGLVGLHVELGAGAVDLPFQDWPLLVGARPRGAGELRPLLLQDHECGMVALLTIERHDERPAPGAGQIGLRAGDRCDEQQSEKNDAFHHDSLQIRSQRQTSPPGVLFLAVARPTVDGTRPHSAPPADHHRNHL